MAEEIAKNLLGSIVIGALCTVISVILLDVKESNQNNNKTHRFFKQVIDILVVLLGITIVLVGITFTAQVFFIFLRLLA